MTKFAFMYHGGGGAPSSPEEGAKIMAAWTQWMGSIGEKLVDGGNPIGATKTLDVGGAVSEGGGENPVTGYSLVEANSMEDAIEIAKGCPIFDGGGTIEICETLEM